MRHVSAMILAASLAMPAGASGTAGVLAVSPPPGPTPELVEITGQIRSGLAERRRDVLEPRELRERIDGRRSRATLEELDRAYEAARLASLNGDYEGAVRKLRGLLQSLEVLPDSSEASRRWTRAMLRVAKVEMERGRPGAARTALEELLCTDPDLAVDPIYFPQRFLRLAEEARARVKARPAQRLTVTSVASGVRAFIDGRERGAVPVAMTLPRGRHKVSGVLGRAEGLPIFRDLGDNEELVVLDVTALDNLRPTLGPGLVVSPGARDLRVLAAGALLGLDEIVTISMPEEGGSSHVIASAYDVRRGTLLREGRIRLAGHALPAGGTVALTGFLAGQQRSGLVEVIREGAAADAPDLRTWPPGSDFRFQRQELRVPKSKAMGWTAFGTGVGTVVLGGITAWQAVSSSDSYGKAEKLLQPVGSTFDRARYGALLSEADAAHKRAVIAGVGAGVCLVATGVLGYLAYKQTGEIGPFRF